MPTKTIHRRQLLAATGAAAIAPLASRVLAKPAQPDLQFHVGTYVAQAGVANGGKGLYPLTFTRKTRTWSLGAPDPAAQNASFAVYSSRHKLHYILNEQADGRVGVYARGEDAWEKRREFSSHGDSPCYVSLDAHDTMLAVANYNTGNVVFYPLDKGGMPMEPALIRQNSGSGPDSSRQTGPHAHCVKFHPDQNAVYSVDRRSSISSQRNKIFILALFGKRLPIVTSKIQFYI